MSAYLIVDVDDIIEYLEAQNASLNLPEVAAALRLSASLASGLSSPNELSAIAVADWSRLNRPNKDGINVQQVFSSNNYDMFSVIERRFMVDALLAHYFPIDADSTIDELILVSSKPDFAQLTRRVNLGPQARVRFWADVAPAVQKGIIFQPLESILGMQSKTLALYIDFENITISLNEQGYIVDLDILINAFKRHAERYGQVVHIAAYAPWGQRGSLPPILDAQGREISDEVPSRLAVASIDPVFSLPGKNSADLRIAKDVLAKSSGPNSPDFIIIASGDRDFNDIYNTLRARGKQVVVWGVRGSTSRILENNISIHLEYIDDFVPLRRHKELLGIYTEAITDPEVEPDLRPSQWDSVVLQFDYLKANYPEIPITHDTLSQRLVDIHVATNIDRAKDLLEQAINIGILRESRSSDALTLEPDHPIVSRTRLIRDHIVYRVSNTLAVRQWDYVNYGFLLKGIAMDEELSGPGINVDDNWRSEWIDFFVREGILVRELIPHRHNPDDLVPVIRVPDRPVGVNFKPPEVEVSDETIEAMIKRIIVSVEQFTSFRKFAWCPLGSLHKRLRPYDIGAAFQKAVETLEEREGLIVKEYPNPQSDFMTKGVSLNLDSPFVIAVLEQRNNFIMALISLYEKRIPITVDAIEQVTGLHDEELELWVSIMELENVLNPVPGHQNLYSLFRTHHTVSLVARDQTTSTAEGAFWENE
ncbi:MAG: NYN domain-containing protein [Anaerolineae bacterium]|nr:MAG: NYN domain-containing protein [Anaerolineae bacterium]MCL4876971.1 NYN domain-containing protein [Anaerolineae bacterium]